MTFSTTNLLEHQQRLQLESFQVDPHEQIRIIVFFGLSQTFRFAVGLVFFYYYYNSSDLEVGYTIYIDFVYANCRIRINLHLNTSGAEILNFHLDLNIRFKNFASSKLQNKFVAYFRYKNMLSLNYESFFN